MLRVAEELGHTEKSECGGPDGAGFYYCHLLEIAKRIQSEWLYTPASLTTLVTNPRVYE